MRSITLAAALAGLVLAFPALARAQQDPAQALTQDPGSDARFHFGPLRLQPTISLTNFGRDTNIFNTQTGKQGDFTATFIPGLNSWSRIGRAEISGRTTLEYLYFRTVAAQRSLGWGQIARMDVPLANMTPHTTAEYRVTNQRPNAEIDLRVKQTTKGGSFGFTTVVGSRTTLDLLAGHTELKYADQSFLGVNLQKELSRTTNMAGLTARVMLTPLTSFVLKGSIQQDRFPGAPTRDSNSLIILPGIAWSPEALISGTASVGYRRFHALRTDLPSFRGLIADVKTNYVISDMTRFAFTAARNIDYSFELQQPYFVSTLAGLTLSQSLAGQWDAVARYNRTWLRYVNVVSDVTQAQATRIDRENILGGGIGYRLTNGVRIGFDVNRVRRLSPLADRQFKGYQFGGSFTYGS